MTRRPARPAARGANGSDARAPASLLNAWLIEPVQRFLRIEAASGIVLLAVTIVALAAANGPLAAAFEGLWTWRIHIDLGPLQAHTTPRFLVNDGLMTLFFLLVGLEIRHETHAGALSSRRLLTLPLLAALGGMLVPALLFLTMADDPALRAGWAIPTATDIAFALGALALLGTRVPTSLRVLLLAFAIIDDIGAVLVIALFYSKGIQVIGLVAAAAGIGVTLWLLHRRVRFVPAYVLLGVVVWAGLLHAGVHPTLAGVALGLLAPVRPATDHAAGPANEGTGAHAPHAHASTALRLQGQLHPWVAWGIMPLFALANAGVAFPAAALTLQELTLSGAIATGLLVGKPLGIVAAVWLGTRMKLCELPGDIGMRELWVVGCLGGIGFTMSMFVSDLAFHESVLLPAAKLGTLAGSGLSAVLGLTLGLLLLRRKTAAST